MLFNAKMFMFLSGSAITGLNDGRWRKLGTLIDIVISVASILDGNQFDAYSHKHKRDA